MNAVSLNKNIIVGNALRYLLKIYSLIHERDVGRKMRDARTIKFLGSHGSLFMPLDENQIH